MTRCGNQQTEGAPLRTPSGFVFVALFGALTSAGSLVAQTTNDAPPLTLADALQIAVIENPELAGLRSKIEAMRERPAQARALPNPMATYSGMDSVDSGRWPYTAEKRLMVQQEFPWFGKRELRERLATKDAEAAQHDLDIAALDVVLQVKENFYGLYAVQRVRDVIRSEQEVLGHMVKAAETRYATGSAPQSDAIKAQTEATVLKQKLWELQAQENTLKAKLNALLNRRADEPFGPLAAPPASDLGRTNNVSALFATAATNRPEVLAAQTQIDRYALQARLMEKEAYPDYKLGLEYRGIDAENDMLMFTVSVELPIRETKYQAAVREAEYLREASEAARASAERQSELEVQDAQFKLLNARRTLDLYQGELLHQAEARFKASETSYRTGQADFLDLLESERMLLNIRTMAAQTEGEVGAAAARLERAIGINAFALTSEGARAKGRRP